MTERKLATIRKIRHLTPIKDADKIELAHVDGWKVVVQKGLHKVNDLVVYFEIDSLLPEIEEFEFLRKSSYVTEKSSVNGPGFRLKTIKLRGQVSQGLIIPIRELFTNNEDGTYSRFTIGDIDESKTVRDEEKVELHISYEECILTPEEGDDLTEILNVKKWERPIPAQLAGKIRGNFPSFIPKTDQERIQNFINPFMEKYRNHVWEVSLKLDGSSMTVYYYAPEDRFGVCSRNLDLIETEDNVFWQIARKSGLEERMRAVSKKFANMSLAIQGELVGPGIQGNRENFSNLHFYMFDAYNITDQYYFDAFLRSEIFDNVVDIEGDIIHHVPVYEIGKMGYDSAEGFLELAEYGYGDGKSINHKEREGLVFKSIHDPAVSFKAISNKYLLNGGE